MAIDKQRQADAHRAYYYLNREKILAKNKQRRLQKIKLGAYSKKMYWKHRGKVLARQHQKYMREHKKNKTLDEQRLTSLLETTQPLEKPLRSIRGRPLATAQRTMFNPNFKVKTGVSILTLRPKRHPSTQRKKYLRDYIRIRRGREDSDAEMRRLERAIKKSKLIEYVRGETPT